MEEYSEELDQIRTKGIEVWERNLDDIDDH